MHFLYSEKKNLPGRKMPPTQQIKSKIQLCFPEGPSIHILRTRELSDISHLSSLEDAEWKFFNTDIFSHLASTVQQQGENEPYEKDLTYSWLGLVGGPDKTSPRSQRLE